MQAFINSVILLVSMLISLAMLIAVAWLLAKVCTMIYRTAVKGEPLSQFINPLTQVPSKSMVNFNK